MSILSIQSSVALGHVGNSASVFPMQRLGFEVWAVPTVLFSNHPGYESFKGSPVPVHMINDMVNGIEELGHLNECEAVLSGYVGSVAAGEAILEAVQKVRAANPDSLYLCDPVMGDMTRKLYVDPKIAEFVRDQLVGEADIIAPNMFELEYLTGRHQEALSDTLFAADALRAKGPKMVLVTSLKGRKGSQHTISNVIVSDQGAWRVTIPQLPLRAKGTGDVFAALFLSHHLRGETMVKALELATSTLYGIIDDTVRYDSDELRLIGAQAEYLNPSFYIEAVRVG